jgi:hypothetical protein
MDVLDNEGEEEPPKPTPTKQPSQATNTSLYHKTNQNYQNSNNYQPQTNFNPNHIYSQKEVPLSNNQPQVASYSAKNILASKPA